MSEPGGYQRLKEFFSSGGEGHEWWKALHRSNQDEGPSRRGDRADLTRCRTLDQLFLTASYHRLRIAARSAELPVRDDSLALVAGILAEVRESAGSREGFGKRMASHAKNSERAVVSGLRFRRLIQIEDAEELYPRLRRIIRLCDRTASVGPLAADLAYWGSITRKNWALQYYENAPQED